MKNSLGFALVTAVTLLAQSPSAHAFKPMTASVGLGYYSQNIANKLSKTETGSSSFLGESNYALNLKFDTNLGGRWYLATQASITPVGRTSSDKATTTKFTHIGLLLGANVTDSKETNWDVYVGPGVMTYQIKGEGGTTTLNNGTGTAVFALPANQSEVKKITTNLGTSFSFGASRVGLDLVVENAFSSKKRALSMMVGYAYQFGVKK